VSEAGEAEEYPPSHHLLRDLALEVEHRDDGTSRVWLTVEPAMLDETGCVRAGVLATMVDVVAGGLSAHAAAPNWIATADLTLHLVRGATSGTVAADARVLRSGRTTVVLEVVLRAGHAMLGIATMTFAVLPRRDDNPVITFSADTPRATLMQPGSGFRAPLLDELDLTIVDAARGIVEVPVTEYSRNSLGALQGGVVAIAIDVAAEQALRAACNGAVRVTDMQVTYLALARNQLRTATEVVHASPAFGTALIDVDDGDGGSSAGGTSRRTTTARVVATRDGA
jgi:uncharacterized protein (TIGR00369 family)